MNDYQIATGLEKRSPLTESELRQMWVRCPTPEVRALLWEIKRLQKRIVGYHTTCIAQLAGQAGALYMMETSAQTLLSEPAVQTFWRKKRPEDEREDLRQWARALADSTHAKAFTHHRPPDDESAP